MTDRDESVEATGTEQARREEARENEREAERSNAAPPPSRRRFRWKRWLGGTIAAIVFVPVIAIALWTWITLSYVYSKGERAGYVQKFSKKGWLCKTWEGELAQVNMPGAMSEKFYFTVRNDSVATVIDSLNRTWDGRVSLHYEQHRGVPFRCFGETEYF